MSYKDIHGFSSSFSPHSKAVPMVDRKARLLIGVLWMLSMLALGYLLSPITAHSSESQVYEFTGELSVNGETLAKPLDTVEDGRESYILIESEAATIRITYSVQSAGNNIVDARFLIEQATNESWQTLMQPSIQAVLGQQMSVNFAADDDTDIEEISFLFTLSERS